MERRASDDLGGRLLRWVDASLITSEQAEAIRAFEEVPAEPRRVPLIAEALGYLGAALALAAGAARLGARGGAVVVLRRRASAAARSSPSCCCSRPDRASACRPPSLWFFST